MDALTSALTDLTGQVWALVVAEEAAIGTWWPRSRPTVRRLRLARLRVLVAALMAQVDRLAAVVVPAAVRDAYVLAAGDTARTLGQAVLYAETDAAALALIAQDTYADVLARTRYVRQTTRDLVRALGRLQEAEKVATGLTALQAARRLEATLEGHGIHAIRYADGSRHGLDEYTRMLMRTKTAETYQTGGLEQTQRLGIEWVEILDGPGCGWASHDDPVKANGLILRVGEAMRYRIAHPNCRRVSTPRPDINSAREAVAARRAQPPGGGSGVPEPSAGPLAARGARDAAGALTPSAGAARGPGRPQRPARPSRPASPLRGVSGPGGTVGA